MTTVSSMPARLSSTMQECLYRINRVAGTISRYSGGAWRVEDAAGYAYSQGMVVRLVERGALVFCEWKEVRGIKTPIKARLPDYSEKSAPISSQ